MLAHILAAAACTPWLIEERYGRTVLQALIRRAVHGKIGQDDIDALIAANPQRLINHAPQAAGKSNAAPIVRTGGVAVIHVIGTIAPRGDLVMNASSSGTSAASIGARFDAAMANPEVGAVVLDIESWGGVVSHVPETAAKIFAARAQKPIFAIANPYAASAAYWLGVSASKFYATPSGEVGSIGVRTAHENISKALEKEGVEIELLQSTDAPFKAEGNSLAPLTDEGRAHIQAELDRIHAMFVKAVADGRGVTKAHVRDNFGRGRTVEPGAALAAGMIDGIKTLDEVIAEAARAAARQTAGRGRSVAANRLDLA